MADMNDQEIAGMVRKAVGDVNHALHVAYYRGLHVVLTIAADPVPRISDVYAARPILPESAT